MCQCGTDCCTTPDKDHYVEKQNELYKILRNVVKYCSSWSVIVSKTQSFVFIGMTDINCLPIFDIPMLFKHLISNSDIN